MPFRFINTRTRTRTFIASYCQCQLLPKTHCQSRQCVGPANIHAQTGPQPDQSDPLPQHPKRPKRHKWLSQNHKKDRESLFEYDPVWKREAHIPISLGGQRWSLVLEALAVIGVTAFVCLTLCKRGLIPKRMTREWGGWYWGQRDRERGSLWPSQLGYGTAAWTNP